MLELDNLAAGYGHGEVLRQVSLRVPDGSIVGILGSNGSGKTTLARTISGLTTITSGDLRYNGVSLRSMAAEAIVDLGIIHVPQGRLLFPEMTIAENLEMGAYSPRARAHEKEQLARVEALFPVLAQRRKQQAGLLSGGEQQMLAIGRALMAMPLLLILDEPSLGLAPRLINDIFLAIREINQEGIAVLVAEQAAEQVFACANEVYVLESGRIALSGSAQELSKSELVRRTYLGIT